MKILHLLFILLFIATGCVSTTDYKKLELQNRELKSDIELYKKAESSKLVEDYQKLKKSYNLLLERSSLAESALEYLKSEGWDIIYIEGTVRIKQNEYDYLGTEYLVVHNVGVLNETVLYEEGIGGSFFMIQNGPAVAKTSVFGIEIIDRNGHANSFSEYKRIR